MSQAAITWGIGIGGFLIVFVVGVIMALYQRHKYMEDTKGNIKAVFLPESSKPIKMILPIEPTGLEIKAPKGHHIGTYYFSKETTWQDDYPDKPFLGLYFLQVPISCVTWGVDNPEPLTPYKHNEVATAGQIFASGDMTYMFALRQAKLELEAERRRADKNRINPMLVYVALVLIIVVVGINVFMTNSNSSLLKDIAHAVGVTVK